MTIEEEVAILRKALLLIRDSTFRSALQLRAVADMALVTTYRPKSARIK